VQCWHRVTHGATQVGGSRKLWASTAEYSRLSSLLSGPSVSHPSQSNRGPVSAVMLRGSLTHCEL
jgi:hypothetical protein